MNGSAFSSPVIATIAGTRQAIVQTRSNLCGVDLQTGETLWTEKIPTFRVRVAEGRVLVDPRPNPPGTHVEPALIPEEASHG